MSDMLSRYNQIVDALRADNDEETLKFFHPDFVVHEDPGMPYGGVFRGPGQFIALRHKVRRFWNLDFIAKCEEVGGKTFVAVFRATGVAGGPTEGMETMVTVVWTFQDGLALDAHVIYYDTPRLSAALAKVPEFSRAPA